MREIKFRAYVPRLKKMGKVSEINWMTKTLLVATNRVVNDIYRLTQVKLMQYTGLKDMNGVEIYEGDVVEYTGTDPYEDPSCCSVVEHENDKFICFDEELGHMAPGIAVIGNKFENQELLEEIK